MGSTRTRKPPAGARRGPASSAGRSTIGRVKANASKKWKQTLRRHPSVGIGASIVLAVVGVALLLTGLLVENLLYFLASALSGLGSLAQARATQLERQRQEMKAPPKVSRPTGPRKPAPEPDAAATKPSATGPVVCTESGKPIDTCGCATRHVATAEGARRYGLPVGAPMGRKAKSSQAPMTSRSGAAR